MATKLVDEIINALTKEQPNLEHALTKTKVLLYRLGEAQLAAWVNAELNGYSVNDDVPDYRIVSTRVLGTAIYGHAIWQHHPIPLFHLEESLRESLLHHKMRESIAVLEDFATSDSTSFSSPLFPEICPVLSRGFRGVDIQTAYKEIGKPQIISILAQIKSRLLDFILELSSRLPDDIEEKDMKEQSKAIGTEALFQHTVIGDNATILVGSNNSQTVSNSKITKNDFSALANFLRENKVEETDIDALRIAIDKDNYEDQQIGVFGPHVKGWMKTMLGKAIETSWQIEVGVSSSLLASALNSYYGWF